MKRGIWVVGVLLLVGGYFLIVNDVPGTNETETFTTKDLLEQRIKKKQQRNRLGVRKFDNPTGYHIYHQGIRTRATESHPTYPFNYKHAEINKARNSLPKNARTAALEFTPRGPVNTPGRSRSIVVSPDDINSNTWILGTVGGGIWKTTDAGETWTNTTPDLPSLAVTSIDIAQSNPDILYAGTGEAIGGSVGIIGSGVYKSVDGGDSWSQLSATVDRDYSIINRAAVHPTDPMTLFICTSNGQWDRDFRSKIFKSTDGGESWAEVYQSDYWVSQIIFNPENPNTLFGTLWFRGIVKSTDGGETWSIIDKGFNNITGRVEIAMAPTDTSWLYASTVGEALGANFDLYLSEDAGESWSLVDQQYEEGYEDLLGGQGNYDNAIAVHPYDKETVYFGGVDLWKTSIGNEETTEPMKGVSVNIANGDTSFWSFVNFGAEYFGGQLELGGDLALDDFKSVQLITGPGLSQKAYRFTVGQQGAGVPATGYSYEDYVDVPFQVWDTENDVQLMVSFRDQQEDGEFTLSKENTVQGDEVNHSREYIFIHDVAYSETEDLEIARDGGPNQGHTFDQMYFFWPVLSDGETFDNQDPERDTIDILYKIDTLTFRGATLSNVSDAYSNYDDKNNAYDLNANGFILHPDHHSLTLVPMNTITETFRIFDCNDGGLYLSNIDDNPGIDDGDWTSYGNGVVSGQFYSADKKPGEDVYIGGMQDNGTWKSPDFISANNTTEYNLSLTGDGFETLWNNVDEELILASSQFNNFAKSVNGGDAWRNATSGISGDSPFISKLANSPSKPNTVFTVTSLGVYKSSNFGDNWELTAIEDNWGFSSFLDVEVSLSNYNIVWAGSGMSVNQSVHVSTDGGESFSPTINYDQAELGNLSGMATHPTEDSTAYILFSFAEGPKILRTEDLGQTWEDISGFGAGSSSSNGFPDVAVYDLLVRPDDPSILWAGTEIGIFESTDNGASWSFLDSELGSAAVWQMKGVDDQIVIATHGRGIWTAQLDEFIEITFTPELAEGGTTIENDLYLNINFNSVYDSTLLMAGENVIHKFGASDIKEDSLLIIENPELTPDVEYTMQLISYRKGKVYISETQYVLCFQVQQEVSEYINDFDDLSSVDFIGPGFTVEEPSGFNNGAIHSLHPYPEGTTFPGGEYNLIFYLRKPLVIGEQNTRLRYDDIAIVEIGEAGTSFGDEKFFDYVVVEGSINGYEWTNLTDGYDAGREPEWEDAFDDDESGVPSMYNENDILLNNIYSEGDEVMIRFRLFTDPLSNGWGWSIDNLSIQEEPITNIYEFDSKILVFPNPSDGNMTLRIDSKSNASISFSLTDVNGRMIREKWSGRVYKGQNEIPIGRNGLKNGVYFLKISNGNTETLQKLIFQ